MTAFRLRAEARETERRAPLTPEGAAALLAAGHAVTVEADSKRVFPDRAYAAAGCALAEPGSWREAPSDEAILGLKELPPEPPALRHAHIHFAHLYKDQPGWRDELARFVRGAGALFDLEYLTREDGSRLAAFGWHAGWLGARLGLAGLVADRLGRPRPAALAPFESREAARAALGDAAVPVRALVIGALGRSGRGAVAALREAGCEVTEWDVAETRALDRDALLAHDLLVNCALVRGPGLLLADREALARTDRRLATVADVSCDPGPNNPLPLYDRPTSWDRPFLDVAPGVALTAIDNLPSLLPRESSEAFAADLLPSLLRFPGGSEWRTARAAFEAACARL